MAKICPTWKIILNADHHHRAGEEIQSLSRFVGAQRLAFQKLLKKYRKWTGSSQLGRRFQKEVLGRPSSFSSRDFEPLLTQWTEVLTAVRAPFSARIPRDAAQSGRKRSASQNSGQSKVSQLPKTSANAQNEINRGTEEVLSSVGDLHFTCERGSNVDIDAALAVLPLGPHAGRASYWVHPDHLVEIHILLLQYTRIRKSISSRNSTSSPSSHRPSRAGSIDGHGTMLGGKPEDDVGVIVCDDLQRFAKRQSAATIDSESMLGSVAERAAASIRYVSTGEAMVVAGTGDFSRLPSDVGDRKMPRIAKFKRKALNDLFDSSTELSLAQSRPSSSSISAESTETNNAHKFSAVRTWLANHLEVQPLVQIQSKRTRFVGLRNSESSGVWATLDIDILMRKCSVNISDCNEAFSTFSNEGGFDLSKFPHALLEVRFEGKGASKLIVALDESHLVRKTIAMSVIRC